MNDGFVYLRPSRRKSDKAYSQYLMPRRVSGWWWHDDARLYGGPYADRHRIHSKRNVCLASEVNLPAWLRVPIQDFGVPQEAFFKYAIMEVSRQLLKGEAVYVGCRYGMGRTGMFIAVMCKVSHDVSYLLREVDSPSSAGSTNFVEQARQRYFERAVETEEQSLFVQKLDTRWIARRIALRLRPLVMFDKRFWLM